MHKKEYVGFSFHFPSSWTLRSEARVCSSRLGAARLFGFLSPYTTFVNKHVLDQCSGSPILLGLRRVGMDISAIHFHF